MDFTNPEIAVTALVALVVVKEVLQFLWPFIRPTAPDPTIAKLDYVSRELDRIRRNMEQNGKDHLEIARIVSTLLEQNSKKFELVRDILERTKDMWDWHNVSDPKTGGKLWYVPQQLQENMAALLQVSNQQTELMRDLDRTLTTFLRTQNDLMRRMGENR